MNSAVTSINSLDTYFQGCLESQERGLSGQSEGKVGT